MRKAPKRCQLSWGRLFRMSLGSLGHHATGSFLQISTVAATAAFLVFVLGEMIVLRASQTLPTADPNPRGRMAHLIWMLGISLIVCTVSNTTSMLLSVRKRFKEIGTMKCLGAFDESILWLFLMEAALLGGMGACLGALLGGGFTLFVAVATHGGAILSKSSIGWFLGSGWIALVTVGCLAFLGAAYPAWQASRMLPVEAMRKM